MISRKYTNRGNAPQVIDPMNIHTVLRIACLVLAALAIVFGALGMFASFLYLASSSMADITAGTSGFVAGSILIGSGLISLTMIATHRNHGEKKESLNAENW
jgi:hypothetical protein